MKLVTPKNTIHWPRAIPIMYTASSFPVVLGSRKVYARAKNEELVLTTLTYRVYKKKLKKTSSIRTIYPLSRMSDISHPKISSQNQHSHRQINPKQRSNIRKTNLKNCHYRVETMLGDIGPSCKENNIKLLSESRKWGKKEVFLVKSKLFIYLSKVFEKLRHSKVTTSKR